MDRGAPLTADVGHGIVQEGTFSAPETIFSNGCRLRADLHYSQVDGYRPLTLDLYEPAERVKRGPCGYPLLIFVHGGSWRNGDSRRCGVFKNFPQLLADISGRGYVVAAVNYRLSGEAVWPAQIDDLRAAIRFLCSRAGAFGIDVNRVFTWGVSAGAHLASVLGGDSQAWSQTVSHEPYRPLRIRGIVAWYGVFDLATLQEQAWLLGMETGIDEKHPVEQLLGRPISACPRALVQDASPASRVSRESPPMLLLAGDQDARIPYLQSLQMKEMLERQGVQHCYHLYSGVGHSFICADDEERTRWASLDAVNRTLGFLDRLV